MKKIVVGILILLTVVACTNNNNAVTEAVNLKVLKNAIEDKESFILEVIQDGCSYCTDFTPKFEKALRETNLTAKVINVSRLSSKDYNSLLELLDFDGSTPTVLFFRDGVETSSLKRIVGSHDTEFVIEKFKSNGFIEEEKD